MDFFKRFTGSKTADSPEGKAPEVEARHLTGEEFDAVTRDPSLPVLVDFWAEWCGPCKAIAPSIARLAAEYNGRAVIAKLDADEYPEILQRYGIMGIPTVIYFQGGQEVDRQVGLASYNALKNKLDRLLA